MCALSLTAMHRYATLLVGVAVDIPRHGEIRRERPFGT